MVAFHYPPFQGSSGVLRTLMFSKYLTEFGWEPWVLTAKERVYGLSGTQVAGGLRIPGGVHVTRAFALDTAKDLAIRGRYPTLLALPDRWSSWIVPAIYQGLKVARTQRAAVLWSTFPIASAHVIARAIKRRTRLPWIADFRDSMTEDEYPTDPFIRKIHRSIEAKVVRDADLVVFTTEGTRRMYAARYPTIDASKWVVLPNGYDEESFAKLEALPTQTGVVHGSRLTLVHSGILYPVERDPQPFFAALSALKKRGAINAQSLRVVLRATGHDAAIRPMVERYKIEDLVTLVPAIPYEQALCEMMESSGLLLFQAANCNHQIPAKLYEYMRSGRPIMALTDERGDTAATLRSVGIGTVANLADAQDIESKMADFLELLRSETAPIVARQVAQRFSRQSRTRELAGLFRSVSVRADPKNLPIP